MVSAEGIESALKRKRNNLERNRRHDLPSFRRSAARAACKRHGPRMTANRLLVFLLEFGAGINSATPR
jgi:hypothetical protein